MAIDDKYIELIHADIDGEIGSADKEELDAFLAGSEDGRQLYDELHSLSSMLDNSEDETPPEHLRHLIMNNLPASNREPQESPGFLEVLFATPALKYAGTFAAGVVLTLSLVDSGEISNNAFEDVTGLVGTVADPSAGEIASIVTVNKAEIAGRVSLRNTESLLILDFDLVAKDPINIEAEYTDRTIWFNGFAQLESEGTTVSAQTGQVTLGMQGKRRYAVYLHNEGGRGTTVNLRFVAGGEIVHEASLDYDPAE